MLKIKDNVDLKVLEKYGFEKWNYDDVFVDYLKFVEGISIIVNIMKDRTIKIQAPRGVPTKYLKEENYVNDLIKANLVEKVDD